MSLQALAAKALCSSSVRIPPVDIHHLEEVKSYRERFHIAVDGVVYDIGRLYTRLVEATSVIDFDPDKAYDKFTDGVYQVLRYPGEDGCRYAFCEYDHGLGRSRSVWRKDRSYTYSYEHRVLYDSIVIELYAYAQSQYFDDFQGGVGANVRFKREPVLDALLLTPVRNRPPREWRVVDGYSRRVEALLLL